MSSSSPWGPRKKIRIDDGIAQTRSGAPGAATSRGEAVVPQKAGAGPLRHPAPRISCLPCFEGVLGDGKDNGYRTIFRDRRSQEESSRAQANELRALVQEQLLAGRQEGGSWMGDTCRAILDTENTSPIMARELLQVGSACIRSAAARFVHAGVGAQACAAGAGVEGSTRQGAEARARRVCVHSLEMVKVLLEATNVVACKTDWDDVLSEDVRGAAGGVGSRACAARDGTGDSSRTCVRAQKRKRGRPPKNEASDVKCVGVDKRQGKVLPGTDSRAWQKLVRGAMAVKLIIQVAAHERERVLAHRPAGAGFASGLPLEAGQHCLCAGLLERSADCVGGLQYTAQKEFKEVVSHILFAAQRLADVVELGGSGVMPGQAHSVAAAQAEAWLGLVKELLQELFSVRSVDQLVLQTRLTMQRRGGKSSPGTPGRESVLKYIPPRHVYPPVAQ